MKKNKKIVLIIAAILAVLTVGVLVYLGYRRKKESQQRYESLQQALDQGAGIDASVESQAKVSLLSKPCDNYQGADKDAETLFLSQGSWSLTGIKSDDDAAIFGVLSGKSSAQLRCIDLALSRKYGTTLMDYIEQVYGEFYDSDNRQKAMTMIKAAS